MTVDLERERNKERERKKWNEKGRENDRKNEKEMEMKEQSEMTRKRETSKSTTTSFPLLALDGQLHKISTHVFNQGDRGKEATAIKYQF